MIPAIVFTLIYILCIFLNMGMVNGTHIKEFPILDSPKERRGNLLFGFYIGIFFPIVGFLVGFAVYSVYVGGFPIFSWKVNK